MVKLVSRRDNKRTKLLNVYYLKINNVLIPRSLMFVTPKCASSTFFNSCGGVL